FLCALRGARRTLRLGRAQAGGQHGFRLARLLELGVEGAGPPLRRLELLAEARDLPGGAGLKTCPQALALLAETVALGLEPRACPSASSNSALIVLTSADASSPAPSTAEPSSAQARSRAGSRDSSTRSATARPPPSLATAAASGDAPMSFRSVRSTAAATSGS